VQFNTFPHKRKTRKGAFPRLLTSVRTFLFVDLLNLFVPTSGVESDNQHRWVLALIGKVGPTDNM
jgi:hypothetical protein